MSASARIICALVWLAVALLVLHGPWSELLVGIAFMAYVLEIESKVS